MRLQRRKEVELERNARMPGRHDAVGDELAVGGRAEMAVDAHPCAHHRILELLQTRRQVGEMLFAHFAAGRSEEHTSELQSLMRILYAVFCLKKKNHNLPN